jgi:hypothetical protein
VDPVELPYLACLFISVSFPFIKFLLLAFFHLEFLLQSSVIVSESSFSFSFSPIIILTILLTHYIDKYMNSLQKRLFSCQQELSPPWLCFVARSSLGPLTISPLHVLFPKYNFNSSLFIFYFFLLLL